MNRNLMFLTGAGLGAGAMFLLDPDRGARRRARVKDKLASAAARLPDAAAATARDIRNRASGVVSEVRSKFGDAEVTDEILEARVRSKMGRIVSHPHAINVSAASGRVTVSGPILAAEVDNLLACVSDVKGVTEVVDQLDVHRQAGDTPGLQGGRVRTGNRSEFLQENWSPAARLVAGAAGGALAAWGLKKRDTVGAGLGLGGLALLARSISNVEMQRLVGMGGGRRAVELQKNINIDAPVEQVYDFWSNVENFPRFMTNVREVRNLGEGRSHWVVSGPAGVPVEWDAVVTKQVPNELLAWKTERGAAVKSAGIVRFIPTNGSTSVDVKLSYNPPAGALGHGAATLFGSDPRTLMDEDLMRMKFLIETGNPPDDAAASASRDRDGGNNREDTFAPPRLDEVVP